MEPKERTNMQITSIKDFNKHFPISENYVLYGASKECLQFLRSLGKVLGCDPLNGSKIYDPEESRSGSYSSLEECVENYNNASDDDSYHKFWFYNRVTVYHTNNQEILNLRKKIIITTDTYKGEIIKSLTSLGLKEDIDFTTYQKALSFWALENKNLAYLYRLDLLVTEKCTLSCTYCNMFMPEYQNQSTKPLTKLINDIDLFFSHIDEVGSLHLVGGEPLLNKELPNLINYIGRKYRHRIDHFLLTTNATVNASKELIKAFVDNTVFVNISNYSESLPSIKKKETAFIQKINAAGVYHENRKDNNWNDFGDPEVKRFDTQEVKTHFQKCTAQYRAIENSKFYYCHLSSSANKSGVCTEHPTDYLDMTKTISKERLIRFSCGDLERGYAELCRSCNGCYTGIDAPVTPASQGQRQRF